MNGHNWYKAEIEAPDGKETVYEIVTEKDGQGFGLALAVITQSKEHLHKAMTEVYTLVAGALEVFIDGDKYLLTIPGQSVRIPPGKKHYAKSANALPARVVVFSSPAWTPDDHHLVSGN